MKQFVFAIALTASIFSVTQRLIAQEIDAPHDTYVSAEAELLARMSGIFAEEDPESIYTYTLENEEISFVLDGSWTSRLESSIVHSFGAGGRNPFTVIQVPVFTQSVDLSTWLVIANRWYFEANFAEEFTRNTFAAGFTGSEDEAIKHIRLGNSSIVFPDTYPFVRFGGGSVISPGIMGTFRGKSWYADLMLRYETALQDELLISGSDSVTDRDIPAGNMIRSRWFVLPDANISGSVRLFTRSSNQTWRELTSAEYRVQESDGMIELLKPVAGSLAALYPQQGNLQAFLDETRSWIPEGFDQAGSGSETAAFWNVTVPEGSALLLKRTGSFSPFEVLSRYASEGGETSAVFSGTDTRVTWLSTRERNTGFSDLVLEDGDPEASLREAKGRFPLARSQIQSTALASLYLPSTGSTVLAGGISIRTRIFRPIDRIELGQDVIPGTILVFRNGRLDPLFRFEETSGTLTLSIPPLSTETIRIEWLYSSEDAQNAALAMAAGAGRSFGFFELNSVAALRWNFSDTGFTNQDQDSPGSMLVAGRVSRNTERATFTSDTALGFSVRDTTGFYRIAGMDTNEQKYVPEESWYMPVDTSREIRIPELLSASDFIPLKATGSSGVRTGRDPDLNGSILYLEADLPGSGIRSWWSAADILAGEHGSLRISTAERIQILLRNDSSGGPFTLFAQLGTSDKNADEYSQSTVVKEIELPQSGSGWKYCSIELDETDRQALGAGQNIRLVAVSTGSADSFVRIYTSYILSQEASFVVNGPEPRHSESPRDGSRFPFLSATEKDIVNRFNPDSGNKVLYTRFAGTDEGPLTLIKSIHPSPLADYRYLTLFVGSRTAQNGTIRVTLSGPDGSGLNSQDRLNILIPEGTLAEGSWHRLSVDLKGKKVFLDGGERTDLQALLYLSSRPENANRLEIVFEEWENDVFTEGYEVFFDEIHLSDTDPVMSVQNTSRFSWNEPDVLFTIGSKPVISNARITAEAGTVYLPETGKAAVTADMQAGMSVLKARFDGSLTTHSENPTLINSSTHSVTLPLAGFVQFTEQYTGDFSGASINRRNSFDILKYLPVSVQTTMKMDRIRESHRTEIRVLPVLSYSGTARTGFETQALFSQELSADWTDFSATRWTDIWQDSLEKSLSAGEPDANRRSGDLSLKIKNENSFFDGLLFESATASRYRLDTAERAKMETLASYSWSWRFDAGRFTLTPRWIREASRTDTTDVGGTWITDTAASFRAIPQQEWLFTLCPVYDLFDPDLPQRITSTGYDEHRAKNTYGILLHRTSIGQLSDVWIPVSADSEIRRETISGTTRENSRDSWSSRISLRFAAMNIAGVYGVIPVFSWYEQDELLQNLIWTETWGADFHTWNIEIRHQLALFFSRKGLLTAENQLMLVSDQVDGTEGYAKNSFRLVWKRSGTSSFVTALLSNRLPFLLSTTRKDTAGVTVMTGEYAETAFTADHELITGIGKNGAIILGCGADFRRRKDGSGQFTGRLSVAGNLVY